jgi:hypothetical protein
MQLNTIQNILFFSDETPLSIEQFEINRFCCFYGNCLDKGGIEYWLIMLSFDWFTHTYKYIAKIQPILIRAKQIVNSVESEVMIVVFC